MASSPSPVEETQAGPAAAPSRLPHIVRNVLVVAVSFGLAAAAGMLRNILIASRFGIGAELDAYYAAFKLPDLLFSIVAGGALATAFIPVFADFLAEDNRAGAWRLAAAITNLVVLVVAAAALLAALAAPWLVRTVIAPGFTPAEQAETAQVMRIVLLSTLIFGVSAVMGSALNGFKHFLLPALGAALYPLGIAAGAVWLAPHFGVMGLAAGAVVGSLLHLLVKVPALLRYGFRWQPVLDLRGPHSPAVRRVFWLMGPRIVDLFVFQFSLVLTTNLASRLGSGGVSALEWGWDAMQLPETIIGTAFGLVAFPTLAELAALGATDRLRSTLGETLRLVLALTVPAAFGLILLGRPLLAFLYQRGQFDAAAVNAVYNTLRFYALGLVGHSCLELAARAFFAQQDTVTPLIVATLSALLSLALGLVLMGSLGAGGLALGNSIAITLEVLALLGLLRRRWGGVEGRSLLRSLGRLVVASAVMALAVWGVLAVAEGRGMSVLWQLLLGGAAGALVYVLAAHLVGVRELRRLVSAVLG